MDDASRFIVGAILWGGLAAIILKVRRRSLWYAILPVITGFLGLIAVIAITFIPATEKARDEDDFGGFFG